MSTRVKVAVVSKLEAACEVVDRLPNWTYHLVGRWIGCPRGLALWSSNLDERWGTGWWAPVSAASPDDLKCHCGRKVKYGFDGNPDHHRGMCADCDEVRCDAYPQDCPWRFELTEQA